MEETHIIDKKVDVAVKKGHHTVQYAPAPKDGVFPLNYYTTSNLPTHILLHGKKIPVENIEMDKGIVVLPDEGRAMCRVSAEIHEGDLVVVGEDGIYEEEIERKEELVFGFMGSEVSAERSKDVLIANVAKELQATKKAGKRVLFVGGPAIVHTGSSKYLAALIKGGYIDVVFGGNAIAAHDLESAWLGTSLGTNLATAMPVAGGHHHHLRTINAARLYGSIAAFIEHEHITTGIFQACVEKEVCFILAGSIRDDGPLPDVITDAVKAQMAMREETRKGFGMAIMVSTMLHSIATGNLLPAETQKVIVDDNVSVVIKLADRGTDAVGIVTDCAYFLSELCRKLALI